MCKYCEYKDDYEWLLSMNMGNVNPYLDMRISTRISPALNKLSLSVSTETNDDEQIITDLPINYCPVCGRSMNADNLIESMGGAEMVAKEIFSKISDLVAGATTGSKTEEFEEVSTELPGYKPKLECPKPVTENAKPYKDITKEADQADWQAQKKNSSKIDTKNASADWDAFFDMAVTDVPIPDLPKLRVGLYNVGVRKLGNDPTRLSCMTDRQIRNAPGVGKTYRPWFIKLRDYAKEVC